MPAENCTPARKEAPPSSSLDSHTYFIRLLIDSACRSVTRLAHAPASLLHQMANHFLQIAGSLINAQLPFGAGAFIQDGVHVLYGAAAAKVVEHVVNKFQQFGGESAHRHFHFFAEVD